ncbi:hypothetical protein [Pseudomonas phage PaeP_Ls]|nr:hypothetical protein [Pseudomonas phage PaeP_Ls]
MRYTYRTWIRGTLCHLPLTSNLRRVVLGYIYRTLSYRSSGKSCDYQRNIKKYLTRYPKCSIIDL